MRQPGREISPPCAPAPAAVWGWTAPPPPCPAHHGMCPRVASSSLEPRRGGPAVTPTSLHRPPSAPPGGPVSSVSPHSDRHVTQTDFSASPHVPHPHTCCVSAAPVQRCLRCESHREGFLFSAFQVRVTVLLLSYAVIGWHTPPSSFPLVTISPIYPSTPSFHVKQVLSTANPYVFCSAMWEHLPLLNLLRSP